MDPDVKQKLAHVALAEEQFKSKVFKMLLDVGCGKRTTTMGMTAIMVYMADLMQCLTDQGWLKIPTKESV